MKALNQSMVSFNGVQHRRGRKIAWILSSLLSVFVLLTSTTFTAYAQTEPPAQEAPSLAWTIYPVDTPPLYFNMTDRSMRYRSDGVPCVAYGGDALYYSCYNKPALKWDTETVDPNILNPGVNGIVMVGSYASLAYNSLGNPFIAYYDAYHGWLKLAYKVGGVWTRMVVDTGVMAANRSSEKEISAELKELYRRIDLRPWRDTQSGLPLDSLAPEYSEGMIGVGKYTSIVFDSDNYLHISYYDEINGSLKYARWNGIGSPTLEIIDDYHDQGDVGLYTSIAVRRVVDRQYVAISYQDEKYDDLKVAVRYGPTWNKGTVDSNANVGTFTSIVWDSVGYLFISYLDFSSYNLKVAKVNPDNASAVKAVVDQSGDVGLYTSLAIDPSDRLHISYYDASNGNLKYARYQNDTWYVGGVAETGNVGLYTSISYSSVGGTLGKIGISYFNASAGALQFAWLDANDQWQGNTVNYSSDVGMHTSLAMTPEGIPHITYMNDTLDLLKYTRYLENNIWYRTYVTTTVGSGPYSSIDLVGGYSPVVGFYNSNKGDLWYAARQPGTWLYSRIAQTHDVGKFVSMDLDSFGTPHLGYYNATLGEAHYAFWNVVASKWVTETAAYVNGITGAFTSIDLDSLNTPYISYFDYTNEDVVMSTKSLITNSWVPFFVASVDFPNLYQALEGFNSLALDGADVAHVAFYDEVYGNLMFADWNGIDFTVSTLDSVGDVGRYPSLVINKATNERHLCYYDKTNGNLKYGYWNAGTWTFENVDTLGDVGMFCDIDIDGLGRPGISYYDASMGDLKYASSFVIPDLYIYDLFFPYQKR